MHPEAYQAHYLFRRDVPILGSYGRRFSQNGVDMNNMKLVWIVVLLLSFLSGCAQVPKESVELSTTLGRDLQEVQRSHRRAIDLLYDRDVERINRYLDDVAMPTYVRFAIAGVGERLSEDLKVALAPNAPQSAKDKVLDEMRKVVQGVADRVARQRTELLAPVEDSRKSSLHELDLAYAEMQRANAVLTAYLSSLTKVHSLQDELLAKAGLKSFREKVGDEALAANAKVTQALEGAQDTEKALAQLKEALAKVKK